MRWLDADRVRDAVALRVLEAMPVVVPVLEAMAVLDDMSLLVEVTDDVVVSVALVVVDADGVLTLVVALVCVTTDGELVDFEPQPTRVRAQPAASAGTVRS